MGRYDIEFDVNKRNSLSVIAGRIAPRSRILEFGTAGGTLTRYLYEDLDCEVYGVEIDPLAATNAAPYCQKIHVGNIENYRWESAFAGLDFDAVIFADVLEHLIHPQKALTRAKKFLAEGGKIFVSLPNIAHNAIIMELLDERFSYRATGLLDRTHLRFFTRKSFHDLLQESGLHCRYMTAIYAPPKATEFSRDYKEFPAEVGEYLLHRREGEAYQYVYELSPEAGNCEEDFRQEYHPQDVEGVATLYLDFGSGFCEEEALRITNPHHRPLLTFRLPDRPIRQIRLDAWEAPLTLRINSIRIYPKNACPFTIQNLSGNQLSKEGNLYRFLISDPQLDLPEVALLPGALLEFEIDYLRTGQSALEDNARFLEENYRVLQQAHQELKLNYQRLQEQESLCRDKMRHPIRSYYRKTRAILRQVLQSIERKFKHLVGITGENNNA